MVRPCGPSELCLHLPGTCPSSANGQDHSTQMTIVFNGKICVCYVNEERARDIVRMAAESSVGSPHVEPSETGGGAPRQEVRIPPPQSMKRSLQRFLQKRRSRVGSAAPYPNFRHQPQQLTSSTP